MKLPVVLPSKNPHVSDETWTEMVGARMARFTALELQTLKVNPFDVVEADLLAELAELFEKPPEEKDPRTYMDLEYGVTDEISTDEVLTIRSMKASGLSIAEISDVLGFTPVMVHQAATGRLLPYAGGIIYSSRKEGLRVPAWHKNIERMTAAVLAEAMLYLTPDLFELLCHQNGYEQEQAFDMLNLLEDRNDEEDRAIYRSFLRGSLSTAPGEFAPNTRRRGRRSRK